MFGEGVRVQCCWGRWPGKALGCCLSRKKSKNMLIMMPESIGWDKGERKPRKVKAALGCEVQKVGSAPGPGPCWSCLSFSLPQGPAG